MSELARRCRPAHVADVWGNVEAKGVLTGILTRKPEDRPQTYLFTGSAGCGKAQPTDLQIPTPDGYRRFGDLQVGDRVFGADGKPTEVVGVFPRGKLHTYMLATADMRFTLCNDDHIWAVYDDNGRKLELTTRELADKGCSMFSIPMNAGVEYASHAPVPAYVVGAFLGNGCCTGTQLVLSSADEYTVRKCAELLGVSYRRCSQHNYSWCFPTERNGKPALVSCKDVFADMPEVRTYSGMKRIPPVYFTVSREERLALLNGLLDTDGSVRKDPRLSVTYSTTSKLLAGDVVELCFSLGISAHIRGVDERGVNPCYRVYIACPNRDKHMLFTLPRKKEITERYCTREPRKRFDRVRITDIVDVNVCMEMQCIKVAAEDGLYLTSSYMVTHNTTLARAFANDLGVDPTDIEEINASSNNGIDDMRALMDSLQYRGWGENRAVILDEVHLLSKQAQNSVLKLFEEPPAGCYIFLCTTDPQNLLPTIVSRCVSVEVHPLPIPQLVHELKGVMKREFVDTTLPVLEAIAEKAQGVPRNALKLLDKVDGLPEDEALSVVASSVGCGEEDTPEVRELCQCLLKGADWGKISAVLKGMKGNTDVEGIRRMVLGYMSSVLLNSGSKRAAIVLECFLEPFHNSGFSGLVYAAFSASFSS